MPRAPGSRRTGAGTWDTPAQHLDCGEFDTFAKLLFHASFVFNGLGGNSLQTIDCQRFIAIHDSRKDLYLQLLAHFPAFGQFRYFKERHETGEQGYSDPFDTAGMTTSVSSSSARRRNIPV